MLNVYIAMKKGFLRCFVIRKIFTVLMENNLKTPKTEF